MKSPFLLIWILSALSSSPMLQGQADSAIPTCSDSWTPAYGAEGKCDRPIYRGEYRDPGRELRLRLPDGVVAFGKCGSGPGEGVRISLSNPTYDKPDCGHRWWDAMTVWAFNNSSSTPQERAERSLYELKKDIERNGATDVEILPATEISFASLTWIDLKASLIQPPYGKLFYELMFAKDPRKDIDYKIGMICSADLCEKERHLFESVVKGFNYVPGEDTGKLIKSMDAGSNRQ
jgi:hypothetical protein